MSGEPGAESEGQVDSPMSVEPDAGAGSQDSDHDLSEVRCLADRATRVPHAVF